MKNKTIEQFKLSLDDIKNIKVRELSVGYQFTRYSWELITEEGCLIRVQNNLNTQPKILFFPSIHYANKNNIITDNKAIEFELTLIEYNYLEDLFYGEFIGDYNYLKKLNIENYNNLDLQIKPKWFQFIKIYKGYIRKVKREQRLFY